MDSVQVSASSLRVSSVKLSSTRLAYFDKNGELKPTSDDISSLLQFLGISLDGVGLTGATIEHNFLNTVSDYVVRNITERDFGMNMFRFNKGQDGSMRLDSVHVNQLYLTSVNGKDVEIR